MRCIALLLLSMVCVLAFPPSRAPLAVRASAGGGSAAPDTTILPTADTEVGDWSKEPAGAPSHYSLLDDTRGTGGAGDDMLYKFDDGTANKDTVRYTLGIGDVTKVTVYQFGEASANTPIVTVEVSPDNSTWETLQNINYSTSQTEREVTFNVSWSNPAFCYVRFGTSGSNFDAVRLRSMQVRVNAP
jgi:hypothetical protein